MILDWYCSTFNKVTLPIKVTPFHGSVLLVQKVSCQWVLGIVIVSLWVGLDVSSSPSYLRKNNQKMSKSLIVSKYQTGIGL